MREMGGCGGTVVHLDSVSALRKFFCTLRPKVDGRLREFASKSASCPSVREPELQASASASMGASRSRPSAAIGERRLCGGSVERITGLRRYVSCAVRVRRCASALRWALTRIEVGARHERQAEGRVFQHVDQLAAPDVAGVELLLIAPD